MQGLEIVHWRFNWNLKDY